MKNYVRNTPKKRKNHSFYPCGIILFLFFGGIISACSSQEDSVYEDTLIGIRITIQPSKQNYRMGEELITTDLVVENVFTNGSTKITSDYYFLGDTFTAGSVCITIVSTLDASKTATFNIDVSNELIDTGLPALIINTSGKEINSKEIWLGGAIYTLYDPSGTMISSANMDIKGRGNSTWRMPKKPYSLKLADSVSLFGMPQHKRWTLLANYSDKTLLRTEVAFKLGGIFDNLKWTPRSEQVDVYLNDQYCGVYQLTEAIKVDANRININKIKKSAPNDGYLLEIDTRRGEIFNFTTTRGVVFCCSDPDDGLGDIIPGETRTLFEKIQEDVQKAENVLYSADFIDPDYGYRKYLDVESFIDWYLVNEITKNNDAIFFSSVYMYYDPAKQKYCMGPIWDFDISLGNINYNDNDKPTGFWIKNATWISQLFNDPTFVEQVKSRWNEKKTEVNGILPFIDSYTEFLSNAASYNFRKWAILDRYVWPNAVVTGSYFGEIAYLKNWLSKRINWLNGAINGL